MTSDKRTSRTSADSKPKLRVDDGDEFALEMATRLRRSVALRLVLGLVSNALQALEVVMEGSVAQALSKRGRRLSVCLGLGEDSLRGTISGEYLAVAIPDAGMCVMDIWIVEGKGLLDCNLISLSL